MERMKKRTPHYSLIDIQKEFATPKDLERAVTYSALSGAAALGLDTSQMLDVVQSTKPQHFDDSTRHDTKPDQWMDVYHVPFSYPEPSTNTVVIYVKFTKQNGYFLISFKKR